MCNKRILIIAALLLALSPLPLRAQFYSFGAEPSGVRWRQIRSEHFRLIYPEETDSLARTYLMMLEKQRPLVNAPVKIDTKPLPVILHAYTTLSNGSVSWAPKHMNLILSPDPYDPSQFPWQEQLVTHELRHVAQTQQFTTGLWGALHWLLGEQAVGVGMGLFASSKYLEGDATVAETELTRSGRGRNAEFLMQIRTDCLEGRFLNWERAAHGSYFKPSYSTYAMGYMLVAGERVRTGDADFAGGFFGGKAGLSDVTDVFIPKEKRYALSRPDALKNAQEIFTKMWQEDAARRGEPTVGEQISQRQRLYCDYWGAIEVIDTLSPLHGSVVVLRRGKEFPEELIQIDSLGNERHIRYHAPVSSKMSESVDGRIYWSECVMHDPSSLENFSEIKYYDTRADRLGSLTRSTKYFNPAISDDGSVLAVAEYPVGQPSHLVLLNPATGDQLERVEAPGKGQIVETVFVGETLYATVATDEGLALLRIPYRDLTSGNWTTVIPPQQASISGLRHMKGQWICFSSDRDGVQNIYALHPANERIFRLTNSRYGAEAPFLDDCHEVLYFSEFDSNGYHLASLDFRKLLWEDVDFLQRHDDSVLQTLVAQHAAAHPEPAVADSSYLDPERYPSRHYSRLLNGFHIHSWAPVYYNVDRIMSMSMDNWWDLAAPGATLYSQNALGDVTAMLGWSWWQGCHSGHGKVAATVVDFDVEFSADIHHLKQYDDGTPDGSLIPYDQYGLTISYPYNFYGGGWSSSLIRSLSFDAYKPCNAAFGTWTETIEAGVRYYRMLSTSGAAIYPRWGFSLYPRFVLGSGEGNGFQTALFSGYAYMPGLSRIQGLKLSLAGHYRLSGLPDALDDSNSAALPRGYKAYAAEPLYLKAGLDYAVPLYLGDVAIPGVLYFQRLQLIPFADYAMGWTPGAPRNDYWSAGVSAMIDYHAFRLAPGISTGVRWSYTAPNATGSRHGFQLLFGLSI